MSKDCNLYPIEVIFSLACACRKAYGANQREIRRIFNLRALRSAPHSPQPPPRFSFWLRLCQQADFLEHGPAPYPTLLFEEWLSWPYYRQITHLVKTWISAPVNGEARRSREAILFRLNRGETLTQAQRGDLPALQALGMCAGEELSVFGRAWINRSGLKRFITPPGQPWILDGSRLVIPLPPDWPLLWQLERYLDPDPGGDYSLTPTSIRQANRRGALDNRTSLVEILERGTGGAKIEQVHLILPHQPTSRLIQGVVLEFDSQEDIIRLRKSPKFRRMLEGILSPRHIAIHKTHAHTILRHLYRKGLLSESDFLDGQSAQAANGTANGGLSKTDQAYMLARNLFDSGMGYHFEHPPGLLARLCSGLSPALLAAASKKASAWLALYHPRDDRPIESITPPLPPESVLRILREAMNREEALDVLYQATGKHSPELRHLTPLLIEERGGKVYLVAYCHTRRAARTFRLDRLQLIHPETPIKSDL